MNKKYNRISAILAIIAMIALFLMTDASLASANPFTTDFAGTETCVDVPGTGEYKVTDGKLHIVSLENVCNDVADDPRISGTNRIVINAAFDINDNLSGPMWGSVYLEKEGGAWIGLWTGERTSDGFAYIRASLRGRGGYEGLHAWLNLERLSPNPADPYNYSGYIFDPGQ